MIKEWINKLTKHKVNLCYPEMKETMKLVSKLDELIALMEVKLKELKDAEQSNKEDITE